MATITTRTMVDTSLVYGGRKRRRAIDGEQVEQEGMPSHEARRSDGAIGADGQRMPWLALVARRADSAVDEILLSAFQGIALHKRTVPTAANFNWAASVRDSTQAPKKSAILLCE